jgi:DNA-binding beta-propeller fold protein YncE
MRLRAHAALLAALAGCAHAPAAAAPRPEVLWPEPPAVPRARLAAIVPDPDAPLPPRPFWRAAFELLTGVDGRREQEETFVRPFGLALAPDGSALVADPDGQRVTRVDAGGTATPLACRSRPWAAPIAVAQGPDGAVWVADAAAGLVVRWTPGGCTAVGAGALERPAGLAVTADRLFVVDTPRHEVVVLSHGGEVLGRWGGHGGQAGELAYPTGIAIAPDGTLLVVDALNFRVARFAPDGRWAGAFGTRGDTGAELARPKAVAADDRGTVYVSDAQRGTVLAFAPDGAFAFAVGDDGDAPGRLSLPAGVAVGRGRLWVADSHNHRVQIFELLGGRE